MHPWHSFVDDARPLDASPLASSCVGLRAVRDVDLGTAPTDVGLRVVLTGGAAQVAGPIAMCARRGLRLAAIDTTLRDTDDLTGNARRVVTALDDAGLPAGADAMVGVSGPPTTGALTVLDVLAEVQAVPVLPLTLGETEIAAWLDAAMDRELVSSLTGGTVDAALDAVLTAARLWGDPGDLAAGRRWIRSWLTTDPEAAVARLS